MRRNFKDDKLGCEIVVANFDFASRTGAQSSKYGIVAESRGWKYDSLGRARLNRT